VTVTSIASTQILSTAALLLKSRIWTHMLPPRCLSSLGDPWMPPESSSVPPGCILCVSWMAHVRLLSPNVCLMLASAFPPSRYVLPPCGHRVCSSVNTAAWGFTLVTYCCVNLCVLSDTLAHQNNLLTHYYCALSPFALSYI